MRRSRLPEYAELHAISNFTFLRGASHPEELVAQARTHGYRALALTDECSVSGVVRAHSHLKDCVKIGAQDRSQSRSQECPGGLSKGRSGGHAESRERSLAKNCVQDRATCLEKAAAAAGGESPFRLIVGAELRLADENLRLVLLAASRRGYGNLCRLITRGRRAATKGSYRLTAADFAIDLDECLALWLPGEAPPPAWLLEGFEGRLWIAAEFLADGLDRRRLAALGKLARRYALPLVAAGDVHMHCRARRALQDTLTAIRLGTPLAEAGATLAPNGERHLRPRERLALIYPHELLAETIAVAERIDFSLDELRYEYPHELVPEGHTPATWLRKLTEDGCARRWPEGTPAKVRTMIEHELELIAELRYEPYFLTVADIVDWARGQDILCQGRGSAANSVVCFCLGVTEVNPARMSMLVERFISRERDEPPDIDVDFEHERREEVIQYIYSKYGRERAALAATVITYRSRSAMRDVGKALGLSALQVDRLGRSLQWWDGSRIEDERVREAGLDPASAVIRRLLALVRELIGFPRHLSQHVGGFVISEGPLAELVPIENAAMEDRTVIQWEKDDLESLGLLKVDVLGLGMLSVLRRSFDLLRERYGRDLTMAKVPEGDTAVYEMICDADTVGVFQIESRAQMSMLPRLKPENFYDLVIEIAIVRPGPIQGDMVHPYLRRRNGEEPVTYPSDAVEKVLERTLGVPIFQEQVMQLAIVAAGFTPGEADRLRRAMAAWKRRGGLEPFEERLISGMRERGYSEQFAKQIFNQIKGFGMYGFPESHSASFALLAYVSAWLKCHYPALFTCALLNSQPMGFYAPSQLVQDAQRHGVTVRPADVNASGWDCTLEPAGAGEHALRLGLRVVSGLREEAGERIVAARHDGPYDNAQSLAERAGLDNHALSALAAAGALERIAGHRHRARWEVAGVEPPRGLLREQGRYEALPLLSRPSEAEDVVADYGSLGLTLRRHPMALLREWFRERGYVTAKELPRLGDGARVRVAGLVVTRQRPGTASGVIFVTLEDETGVANLVVWSRVAEVQRKALVGSRIMGVEGKLQIEGKVIHVVAQRLRNHDRRLAELAVKSRNFH